MDKLYRKIISKTQNLPSCNHTAEISQETCEKRTWMLVERLTFTHVRLTLELSRCFAEVNLPEWTNKGKNTKVQKYFRKGSVPNNYRPITCPHITLVISAVEIREDIYYSLIRLSLIIVSKKIKEIKRRYQIVDFVISVDHRVKIKENEKRDKYLDLAR